MLFNIILITCISIAFAAPTPTNELTAPKASTLAASDSGGGVSDARAIGKNLNFAKTLPLEMHQADWRTPNPKWFEDDCFDTTDTLKMLGLCPRANGK